MNTMQNNESQNKNEVSQEAFAAQSTVQNAQSERSAAQSAQKEPTAQDAQGVQSDQSAAQSIQSNQNVAQNVQDVQNAQNLGQSQSFDLPPLDLSDPLVQQILNGTAQNKESAQANNESQAAQVQVQTQAAQQPDRQAQAQTQAQQNQATTQPQTTSQSQAANPAQDQQQNQNQNEAISNAVAAQTAQGVQNQTAYQSQEQLAQQIYELEMQKNAQLKDNSQELDSASLSENDKKKDKKEKKKRSPFVGFLEFVVVIALAIGLAYFLTNYVVKPYEIPSESMEETIMVDDRVLSETLSYAFGGTPQRGDIVTFIDVEDSNRTLIKRVIATAGQVVDLRDGYVYVDGKKLDESYTGGKPSVKLAGGANVTYPYTVPDDSIWVMGDNRTNSSDSRVFGAIPLSNVTGKAFVRYWPLDRISTF